MLQSTDGKVLSNTEMANNNNICTKSLLQNLVSSRLLGNASSSSLDQHSNSSSLESIESPALDGNQALSTSCSEDSFELSSTTSKPATDDPSQLSFQDFTSSLPSSTNSTQPRDTTICVQKNLVYKSPERVSMNSLEPCSSSELSSPKKMGFPEKAYSLIPECSQFDKQSTSRKSSDSIHALQTTHQEEIRSSESWPKRHGVPCSSKSANSIANIDSVGRNRTALREFIDKELDDLDTCLPQLDFNKLEEKLNCAAKERIMTERKLLGEQVRRRLALQVDQYTAEPAPRVYTRPSRSNLGFRLQTAMNLQVCYINDLKDDEEEEESSDDDLYVPKSKSAPNLRSSVIDGSNLNASQLRQAISTSKEQRQVLEEETRLMLAKAKQAAKMQMEIEKQNTGRFTTAVPPKASRLQLSKMTCRQLVEMSEQLSKRIDEENGELMRLLMEKDTLHMQQDSMLVDIEDMIQHESNSESLNLPDFLKVQVTSPMATSKFRIFKR